MSFIGTFTSYLDQSEFEMWRCDTELFKLPNVSKNIGGCLHFKVILESTYFTNRFLIKTLTPSYFRFSLSLQRTNRTKKQQRERRGTEESQAPSHTTTPSSPHKIFNSNDCEKKKERKRTLENRSSVYMNNRVTR